MADTPSEGNSILESRVLIIMTGKYKKSFARDATLGQVLNPCFSFFTGGTISMKRSEVGYVPVQSLIFTSMVQIIFKRERWTKVCIHV